MMVAMAMLHADDDDDDDDGSDDHGGHHGNGLVNNDCNC